MRISDWSSDVCSSDLAPFYGSPPPLEDVPKIKAELLVVLAANDERVNAAWPGYEAALEAAQVQYTLYQPAGTQHGLNNDPTPRYDAEPAAEDGERRQDLYHARKKTRGGEERVGAGRSGRR